MIGLYGCQAWNLSLHNIEDLEYAYFDMLRILLRLPTYRLTNPDKTIYLIPATGRISGRDPARHMTPYLSSKRWMSSRQPSQVVTLRVSSFEFLVFHSIAVVGLFTIVSLGYGRGLPQHHILNNQYIVFVGNQQ